MVKIESISTFNIFYTTKTIYIKIHAMANLKFQQKF